MYNSLHEVEMEIDKIFRESSNDVDNIVNHDVNKTTSNRFIESKINDIDSVNDDIIHDQIRSLYGDSKIDDMSMADSYEIQDPMSVALGDSSIDDIDGLIQFLKDGKKRMEELWKISGEEAAITLINDRCIDYRDFKITAEHYKEITEHLSAGKNMGILGTLADKISVEFLSDFNDLMKMAIKKDASTDVDFYSFGFIRKVAKVWDLVKNKL